MAVVKYNTGDWPITLDPGPTAEKPIYVRIDPQHHFQDYSKFLLKLLAEGRAETLDSDSTSLLLQRRPGSASAPPRGQRASHWWGSPKDRTGSISGGQSPSLMVKPIGCLNNSDFTVFGIRPIASACTTQRPKN